MPKPKTILPPELQGVARVEDVNAVEEKISKCYSHERYQEFQEAVEKIALKTMGNDDGRKKVKEHATEAVKDFIRDESWKSKTFWIPTIIAGVAALAAIIAILK